MAYLNSQGDLKWERDGLVQCACTRPNPAPLPLTSTQVTLSGNVKKLVQCASTGEILMTEGAISPLNVGMMAWKPSLEMYEMALYFAAYGALPPQSIPLATNGFA